MATAVPSADLLNLFPASPLNSVIRFERMPYLTYLVQECGLPGMSVTTAKMGLPGMVVNLPPDHIIYDPLTVTFLVDEEYNGVRELMAWIVGTTGREDRTRLVAEFVENQASMVWYTPETRFGRLSETTAGLTIVNANKIPILHAAFFGVRPTNISEVHFDTKTTDPNIPLVCTATFAYDYYTLVEIRR